jgi:DNA-binding CsgD family transcriptional regulator
MDRDHSPAARSGPRTREALEQRIARTAIEVSHAAARGEDFGQYLADQAQTLFSADAGTGLTRWCPDSSADFEQIRVVVSGVPPLTLEEAVLARPFAATHPGFLAMARLRTTAATRLSDHTNLPKFWTTESYWRMHGHSDGRYPAALLLLVRPTE